MLEDDLDLDQGYWRKLNGREEKQIKSRGKNSRKLSLASAYAPAVVLNQGSAEKDTGGNKEKGRNANQVVLKVTRK
jgi:hypothetical protein